MFDRDAGKNCNKTNEEPDALNSVVRLDGRESDDGGFVRPRAFSNRAEIVEDSQKEARFLLEKLSADNENPLSIDIEKNGKDIAQLLNLGRSDLAASKLSKALQNLSGETYNQLLVKVAQAEEAEIDGDDRGHLLLSDWNKKTATWDHVYIAEGDQLYRFVQPGITVADMARDRLGEGASEEAVKRYVKNIQDVNFLPAPELVLTGQALRLPYPS